MSTQYYTASSVDGFIADADNSLDWLLQFGQPGSEYEEFIAGVGALAIVISTLLGIVVGAVAAVVIVGLILGILAFYSFDLAWIMTKGGPQDGTAIEMKDAEEDVFRAAEELGAEADPHERLTAVQRLPHEVVLTREPGVPVLLVDVHRAAEAAAVAGLASHELGHHAVGAGTLGDAVAVAAVGGGDHIPLPQGGYGPDGDGLLSDVEVRRPVDLALGVEVVDLLVEGAAEEHLL